MATIMQRDVLIEAVAYSESVVARNINGKSQNEADLDVNYLDNLYLRYMKSDAKDLNFDKEVAIMKSIRNKYDDDEK